MICIRIELFPLFIVSFLMPVLFAAKLQDDEVQALKIIGRTLGKKDWDFSLDPCSNNTNWTSILPDGKNPHSNYVRCNCSYQRGTVCHVTLISLRGQNLPGELPVEMTQLNYLQEIDLSRNMLKGIIPPEWSTLPLTNLVLQANLLSGSIPKEIGEMKSLLFLNVESNRLSGFIPPELGDVNSLEKILISSNYFVGELSPALAKLSNLKEFRANNNGLTGKIPHFMQKWTKLQKLHLIGTKFEGPIPPNISVLRNLIDLRISDIKSPASAFPDLSEMKDLDTLILRNCNISGEIPEYIGELRNLTVLDLSFNQLSGPIPESLEQLRRISYIYFTSNYLNGPVPRWMQEKNSIDLSYNNFTARGSKECQEKNVNLFGTSLATKHINGIFPCLKDMNCAQKQYSLHINCGGNEITNGSTRYEKDDDQRGSSIFVPKEFSNWGYSSTGHFLDDSVYNDNYLRRNASNLPSFISELYTTARTSPLSLTYYAWCLYNGNYTVSLHFAEITFTDYSTYYSLGQRIFDVYIQGILVLNNFNIKYEAGGFGKPIVKEFHTKVTSNTLEIRLYWAGKGTTDIPVRGTYGPLISAISVEPGFPIPRAKRKMMIIVGIPVAVGISASVLCIIFILWKKRFLKDKYRAISDFRAPSQNIGFTLKQIKAATNNFNTANKIGEGGFGSVYKGFLADGTAIAVKQLSPKSEQGNREFINEVGLISSLQHPNLVKLYGCCTEGDQLLLIYEYMENNSLAHLLFGSRTYKSQLNWFTRKMICIGIAKGLSYLHEESKLKIVHRDIKGTNILLDKDFNPKIADFGLARLNEGENTHIITRVAGTIGYLAPEYARRGILTDKADVYSFGILTLELVSGIKITNYKSDMGECEDLLDWAHFLQEKGRLVEIVDPRLESEYNEEEALAVISVAILCCNLSPTLRPSMSTVVCMLENKCIVRDRISNPISSQDSLKLKAMRNCDQCSQTDTSNIGNLSSSSSILHWSVSSTTATTGFTSLDADAHISDIFSKNQTQSLNSS